ncbi:hypothetical protein WA026_012072 [Henosepilachna vigintioctopunctata]|uniref:Uncharacterized protein n=1 Tax=Henosepilachna vigintioctopunctata TaxID=420089 RepID=A0AAW1VC63_9CUCU
MKGLVIFCLVAVLVSVNCGSGDDLMKHFKLKYVEAYLQQRQALDQVGSRLEQICPGSKTKLETAFDEMKTCADKIDETAETSCSILKNKAPKCIEPVMKVLKDCMPQQSKEVPQFMLNSLLKGVDYICKTDGEHIFELGNVCLHRQNPMTLTCKRKLTMRLQTYHRNGLGVNDICSLMKYMRPCLKTHFSYSCGSAVTQEAVLGLYDAFLSNCVATENEIAENEKTSGTNLLEDFSY